MNSEISLVLKALIQFKQVEHLKNIGVEILDPKLLKAFLTFQLIKEVHPNVYIASEHLEKLIQKTNLSIIEELIKKNI